MPADRRPLMGRPPYAGRPGRSDRTRAAILTAARERFAADRYEGTNPNHGTASIAALAGFAQKESGIASGFSNTSFQIGAALGVAIVSTVAVSRTEEYLAANNDANSLRALTEGFQSAFVACAVLAGIGVALALLLPRRPRTAPAGALEPVLVTSGGE
jgi:hypothetical protein